MTKNFNGFFCEQVLKIDLFSTFCWLINFHTKTRPRTTIRLLWLRKIIKSFSPLRFQCQKELFLWDFISKNLKKACFGASKKWSFYSFPSCYLVHQFWNFLLSCIKHCRIWDSNFCFGCQFSSIGFLSHKKVKKERFWFFLSIQIPLCRKVFYRKSSSEQWPEQNTGQYSRTVWLRPQKNKDFSWVFQWKGLDNLVNFCYFDPFWASFITTISQRVLKMTNVSHWLNKDTPGFHQLICGWCREVFFLSLLARECDNESSFDS